MPRSSNEHVIGHDLIALKCSLWESDPTMRMVGFHRHGGFEPPADRPRERHRHQARRTGIASVRIRLSWAARSGKSGRRSGGHSGRAMAIYRLLGLTESFRVEREREPNQQFPHLEDRYRVPWPMRSSDPVPAPECRAGFRQSQTHSARRPA